MKQFDREIRLIGQAAFDRLQRAKVAVYGLGGVGGHAALALARAGIGRLYLVDGDVVDETNINRQAAARHSTVGMAKADVIRRDILDINPKAEVTAEKNFLTAENLHEYLPLDTNYVLDCIDNITCKLTLAKMCYNKDIPILSCMGAGNRVTACFQAVDLFSTQGDPVAKIMRKLCREAGIKRLPVVCAQEPPLAPADGQRTPASISFIPPAAGLKMAEVAVNALMQGNV